MREDELSDILRHVSPVDGHVASEYAAASDRASKSDKQFFEQRADRDVRRRSPVPGEFGPFVDYTTIAFVRVDKVDDDTRLRSIILWAGGPR
jgi:hypothetical protein